MVELLALRKEAKEKKLICIKINDESLSYLLLQL